MVKLKILMWIKNLPTIETSTFYKVRRALIRFKWFIIFLNYDGSIL